MTRETCPITHKFLMGRARDKMSKRHRKMLEDSVETVVFRDANEVIIERGAFLDKSTYLVDGFIARVIREGGERHIVSMHVPGDFVDIHAYPLKRLDHDLVSINPVRVGYIPHTRLDEICATEPELARMLWFSSLLDAAIHRTWILRLEKLNADGRVAHMLAELWTRLKFVGLSEPEGFSLPLTQLDLAQSCGTTAIHMNRVIRKLREEKLADVSRGRVTIFDPIALEEHANFDESYLYGNGTLKYI